MDAKQQLVEYLRNYVCEVTFTKKDGTERIMVCTLRQDKIEIPLNTKEQQEVVLRPNNVIRVFDLENNGWRSFDCTAVKRFTLKGSK
jgi:hypothetical protein